MKGKGCLTRCFSSKAALHITILFLHRAAFHNRFLKRACHRVLSEAFTDTGAFSILRFLLNIRLIVFFPFEQTKHNQRNRCNNHQLEWNFVSGKACVDNRINGQPGGCIYR